MPYIKVPAIEPLEARIAPAVLTITALNDVKEEGSSGGTTSFSFKVSLDVAEPQDVTVVASIVDGTAKLADGDFSAFTQTITIPRGQLETAFTVPIRQDTTMEADETFSVDLSSPSINAVIGDGSATSTIKNDDFPKLSIKPVGLPITEGTSADGFTDFGFEVELDKVSETDVKVLVSTKDGTAKVGDGDYTALTLQEVTIPAGQTKASVIVKVRQDSIDEGASETFSVELSSPTSNALIGTGTASTTITDDDPPILTIENATVVEGADGQKPKLVFTAKLSAPSTETVTFQWNTISPTSVPNGTALAGSDYTAVGISTVTFAPGETTATFEVEVLGDNNDELGETLKIAISNAKIGTANLAVSNPSNEAVGTILNDELTVTLTGQGSIVEGNTGSTNATYTLSLGQGVTSAHPVTVELEFVNKSATAGNDFSLPPSTFVTIPAGASSQNFIVPIRVDSVYEGDETFEVRIKSVTDAVPGALAAVETRILEDDEKPTLTFSNISTVEGNGESQVSLTVSIPKAAGTDITFNWSTLNGTALAGLDFTEVANQQGKIAAGQLSTTLVLTKLGDKVFEKDETFSVVLTDVVNAALPTTGGTATVTLTNDEEAPKLSIADAQVFEGEGANPRLGFVVSITNDVTADQNIQFDWVAALGTATPGVDYTAVTPSAVALAAGQTSVTLFLNVNDDSSNELDETVIATIGGAKFADGTSVAVPQNQATGRILNDDLAVSIAPINNSVAEGAEEGTFITKYRISIPAPSAHDVRVTVQVAEESVAKEGTDFTFLTPPTVTIPAGQTFVDFEVTIKGDSSFETNEALTLELVNPVNAAIGTGSATTTITNDDAAPRLTIDDQRVYEGQDGNTVMSFTVRLTNAAGEDVTASEDVNFQWSTLSGTAIAGVDFSNVTARTATIPKDTTSATITVALSGDAIDEVDETFLVALSNAMLGETPITISDAQATGTILNDDTSVRIANASVTEGNSGTSNLEFAVSIGQISAHDVTVTFEVVSGTARTGDEEGSGPADYNLPAVMTVTIPAGQTVGTISIPILGDTLHEQNETLVVKLKDSTNAKVVVDSATGTIVNDDAAPTVSIANKTFVEGDSGTTAVEFTLTLSEASGQDVTVLVTPTGGTALQGSDFTAETKTVTIKAGETSAKYKLFINGDATFENDESFNVVLSNATGAVIGQGVAVGSIPNVDEKPRISISNAEQGENTGSLTFTITLDVASGLPVTLTAATVASIGAGAATAGTDYTSKTQNFTIPAGQTSATFAVAIGNDALFEADETFTVQLSNILGATALNPTGTGKIVNDDRVPTISATGVTVVEGDSGTKEVEVVVSLSSLAGSDVTFDWQAIAGTALAGEDFTAISTSPMTILAGQSSARIKFSIAGDAADEEDESFQVKISNVQVNGSPLAPSNDTATVKILNDDLSVSVDDVTKDEGDPTVIQENPEYVDVVFKIRLSGPSQHPVTVNYATQDGSAISTADAEHRDFESLTDSVTFNPGDTEKTVTVKVLRDQNFDGTDQFKLLLTSAENARIADGEATATIDDDDVAPTITIDTVAAIAEDAGELLTPPTPGVSKLNFTVRLDHASDEVVEVYVSTVDGTAVAGSDFTGITKQKVTFAPGELSKTVTVDVLNDATYETDQSFKLVLSEPVGGTLGSAKEQTATITSEDAEPTLQVIGQSILEGNNGERFLSFVVQRTGATDENISFRFTTLDGTIAGASAVAGSDFEAKDEVVTMAPGESSKTVMVKVLTDAVDERDEQFQVQISDLDGAQRAEGTDGKATGTIFNDDLTVSLSQGTVQVAEGNTGQADMVFTVNLSSPSTHATEVTYTVGGGTATAGTDYLAPTPLTMIIPAGESSGQIRIPILGDATAEKAETLTVTLTGAKDAELGASDLVATGTILNDDAALSISNATRVEGANGSAMMRFTVTLDAPFSYPVTVNYATSNGTATAGSDYTNTQGTLTFGVNETSKDIEIPILGDTAVEGDETFTVTLSNANGASILGATATGTIQDDESTFSISDATLDEGNAGTRTMTFTVTRAPGSTATGTVRVSTQDDTAISTGPNVDFVAKTEVLTFAANETTKTFSVVVNSDTVFEVGQERFSVVLSDATAAVIADGQATGTITNSGDAIPTISIGDASVIEGNSGTKALKFTVSLSAASEFPVSFDFATALSTSGIAAGRAEADDFTAQTQTYIIPAGQKTFEIEVQVNGDDAPEADEVFLGRITSATVTPTGQQTATGLAIADGEAVGTIRNDDSTVSIVTTASGNETNAPGSKITVRITLKNGETEVNAPVDIPVSLQFASGTAIVGTDFTLPNLTAVIEAGKSFVDVEVEITGDVLDEADETFTITASPTAHALPGSTISTVTINDNDEPPAITVANVSVVEGNNAAFKVTLSEASGRDVVVKWMTELVSGTGTDIATAGDFAHSTTVQTLVIPAGQTTGTINIATTNDTIDELDETFKLRILASTENAEVPQDIFATATIEKNDLATYSIADASITEGATGPKTLTFTVTRTASNLPGSINYTTSNTTGNDAAEASTSGIIGDYESKSGTIDFLPGETSKTIEITINGDATSELDEKFSVTLSNEVNGTLGRKTATGTILNDEVTYYIERVDTDNPFTEEKTAGGQQIVEFRIVRKGAAGSLAIPGTVSYSTGINPTAGALQATAGTDYTVKSETISFAGDPTKTSQESDVFKVLITSDSLTEGDETFALKLSNALNGQISTDANEGEQIVTIVDNDADKLPSITISDGKIVEGADGVTSEMVFKVKLVDSDGDVQPVAGAVTVRYSTADLPGALTARAGQDYLAAAENAFLTFAAGETEKEIRIPILGDSVDEIDETFSVEIDGAVFKVPGSSTEIAFASTKLPAPATGTITNDDLTVTLDPLSSAFEGNGAGQITFVARLSQPSTHAVTFKVNAQNGTATAATLEDPGDFVGGEQLVTIEAGQTTKTFTVAVNGDLYAEADETFTLALSEASNALLGTTSRVITLQNDDAAPTLSVQDANITEGDNGQMNLVFTVVLSGATLAPVTVDWATADGTAKSSGVIVDFLASNGVVTFDKSAGASQTKTFSVPILGDTWKEDVEQFTVQLSNARLAGNASGVTITDATADGRIFDNGDAVLGVIIHDARIAEGNSGTTNLQFTIETTAAVSGTAVTLRADTRVNTANESDFTALVNRAVTIPVGQKQITLDVPVKGDSVFEASEYFLLDLTGFNSDVKAVNGSATTATATGTILNDDIKFAQGSREVQYVDADGDLVTVKFSKGTLRVQGISSSNQTPHITFSTVNALGGRTLDTINLSISGEEFAFEGVNISMVAKPQILVTGEVLGDGKADVGSLVAATLNSDLFQISSGVSLGKVSIPGNLGVLIAGSTKRPDGVGNLELGSFGSDKGSLVLGPIKKMVVAGDFTGNLSVVGDVAARPIPTGGIGRIGNLVIGGLLKGGAGDGSGRITFTGGIGKATIGGIEGGSGDASATLVSFSDEFNTRIDSLTVLGDIAGGAGDTSALIEADHIGSLTLGKTGKTASQLVSGSIVGGAGELSGVVAANTYGNVVINGDLRGGEGDRSGYLVGNVSIGNARITGNVIGGSGDKSGLLEVGNTAQNGTVFVGSAKSITIGNDSASDSGDVIGGTGVESGRIRVTGSVTKFLAYGDIVGGKGTTSGSLSFGNNSFTASLLKSAVIKGSILGGSTDASGTTGAVTTLVGTGFLEAERIGSITVNGGIKSGENKGTALAKSGGIYAMDSIASLKIGSVTGTSTVPVIISALRSIGSATFEEHVTHLELLAGYTAPDATKARGVLRDAGASIDSVTVRGTFTASSIVAGVHAGTDGKFGTLDDVENSNGAGTSIANQDLISRIASVVINEVGVPTGDATSASYGIVAEYVKKLKVAGVAVALTPGASGDGPTPILPAGSKLQILEIE